jgi:hypothetical protein
MLVCVSRGKGALVDLYTRSMHMSAEGVAALVQASPPKPDRGENLDCYIVSA